MTLLDNKGRNQPCIKQWLSIICKNMKEKERKLFMTVNQRVSGSSPEGGA